MVRGQIFFLVLLVLLVFLLGRTGLGLGIVGRGRAGAVVVIAGVLRRRLIARIVGVGVFDGDRLARIGILVAGVGRIVAGNLLLVSGRVILGRNHLLGSIGGRLFAEKDGSARVLFTTKDVALDPRFAALVKEWRTLTR